MRHSSRPIKVALPSPYLLSRRMWDELDGIERPRIWAAERDREVWAQLQG